MFVENFQYRLLPEVAIEDFVTAIDRSQREFLAAIPGFVRRLLTTRADGSYSETILWESEAHMGAAVKAFETCQAALDLMKMIDERTLVAQHGRCVVEYGA